MNTLRISNYLTEVKRSVSHAHSTSLMYYALIPVNSLARMAVHMWRLRAVQSLTGTFIRDGGDSVSLLYFFLSN